MAKLKSVSPISNEDASALPVKELGQAIAYYESVMGFTMIRGDATTAALQRDGARIGLVIKRDHQPHDAGSLAFAVDDLDGLHRELSERGGKPGKFGIDKWAASGSARSSCGRMRTDTATAFTIRWRMVDEPHTQNDAAA